MSRRRYPQRMLGLAVVTALAVAYAGFMIGKASLALQRGHRYRFAMWDGGLLLRGTEASPWTGIGISGALIAFVFGMDAVVLALIQ